MPVVGLGHEYFKYYGEQFDMTGTLKDPSLKTGIYEELNFVRVNRTAQLFSLNNIVNGADNDVFWRFNAFCRHAFVAGNWNYSLQSRSSVPFSIRATDWLRILFTAKPISIHPMGRNRSGIDVEMQNMMYKTDIANTVIKCGCVYCFLDESPTTASSASAGHTFGRKSLFVCSWSLVQSISDVSVWMESCSWMVGILCRSRGGYASEYNLTGMFTKNRFCFPTFGYRILIRP